MSLHLETISDLLWDSLRKLMKMNELKQFRLVGGTSLSLQLGHRMSIDIDLFTDAAYGSVDFDEIEKALKASFPFVDDSSINDIGAGRFYFVGNNKDELLKLDIMYSSEPFVFPLIEIEGIRLASIEEIAAMKLDVVSRGGRKKDFWDLHELLNKHSIEELIEFYEKRHPYGSARSELILMIKDFSSADSDPDPECLRGKYWELIKLDFEELDLKEE
ncbi:MAG: hypothetical protein CMP59_10175 [Flavobacteriales bacterium]|nr:hypothetical protein [Flavobacteriales bacterium]